METTVKEPITLEIKNASIGIYKYSVYVNGAELSDIFHKLLGEGSHKAHITISISPSDPQTTIIVGDRTVEVADLAGYVKENEDE